MIYYFLGINGKTKEKRMEAAEIIQLSIKKTVYFVVQIR